MFEAIARKYSERTFYLRNRQLIRCELEDKHKPILVNLGMTKVCPNCGRWDYK